MKSEKGKLNWPKKERMQSETKQKRPSKAIMGGASINEAPGEIDTKQFGHVKKTTMKLHGSDPYIASHKL